MGVSNEELLKNIRHYQESLDRYTANKNNYKLLGVIEKLKRLPIATAHLEDTGIGRTVNALRKLGGEVGDAAKGLVSRWKEMVVEEEEKAKKEAVEESVNTACSPENDFENYSESCEEMSDYIKDKENGRSSSHILSDTETKSSDKSRKVDKHASNSRTYASSEKKDKHRDRDSSSKKRKQDYSSDSDAHNSKKRHVSSSSESEEDDYEEKPKSKSHRRHRSESSDEDDKKHKSKKSRYSSDDSDSEDSYRERKSKSSSSSKSKSSDKTENKRHNHDSQSKDEKSKSKHKSEAKSKRDSDCEESKSSSKHKSKRESKSDSDEIKSKSKDSKSRHEKESSKSKESKSRSDKHDTKDKKETKVSESKDKHRKYEEKPKKPKDDKESSRNESRKEKSSSSNTSKSEGSKSSSSKHKSGSERKKEKVKVVNSEKIVNGIDSGSGASFADALGMCGPVISSKSPSSKKKKTTSTPEKPRASSSYSRPERYDDEEDYDDHVPTLLKQEPPEPLNINISSLLPEITPHYKPLGIPVDSQPRRIMTQDEALSHAISNKNMRTKVYSGNKSHGKVDTLFDLCVRILQENIDALEYTGGVPYSILKPVLERATPDQLFNMEHHNPYLVEDTDGLWQLHCQKEFRTKKREELESWREMYMRCLDEREARLNAITATIKQSQDKSLPVRTTKLAYIDSVVKPPRNIARKQAKNGIILKPAQTPASRLSALATSGEAGKVAVPNPGSRAVDRSSSSSSNAAALKPKKAPLMAKTLSLFKNRFRR